ncbi:MAG: biotin--[acetyl-CoA-carboxylase] ligase [Ignavibacteriae bacterium]|nr:biotin--[acetyl-CoA-carboxylase] ligase [Ignavibacteriota bacterium]
MKIQLIKESLLNIGLKDIVYFSQLHSTNKYAKENKIESDNLIITSYQYEGRGRFDRIWESIEGDNLTFSIVKSFKMQSKDVFIMNFYTSYIVLKAIKDIFPDYLQKNFSLKWPNDLLLREKKFGGILSELININDEEKKFIIGVGINVNQKEFSDSIIKKATSLRKETGIIFELEDLLIRIIKQFYENMHLLFDTENILKLWKENSHIINKEVKFKKTNDNNEITGKVIDIMNNGGIKIETTNEFNTKNYTVYYTGEISFIY